MADDKKKQAMSLLFGDAPPKPKRPRRASRPAVPTESADVAPTPQPSTPEPPEEAPSTSTPSSQLPPGETPDPYYEGQSRYRRRDGTEVKHSIYLDEEVSRALKLASARGDDPRGTSMSAIVNQALRELGYRA